MLRQFFEYARYLKPVMKLFIAALAAGALASDTGVWSFLGPAVLLISALLTAGYLLPVSLNGFFPGEDLPCGDCMPKEQGKKEPSLSMLVPIGILTAGTLLSGIFPQSFFAMLTGIAERVF